ncbi:MAG TPA: S8 family serine peptidase, partial [Actinomycetota bacterium]|nr:S8 family serine peptidase [Actinomycetota bacterium]
PDPNTNPAYDEDDLCDDGEWQPEVIDMKGANGDTTSGHGTHVSAIIAGDGSASNGLYTGVAPGAKLNSVGTGDVANIFWSLEGFEYLLKHAAADNLVAINNSYGGSRATATTDTEPPSPTAAVRVAAETAIRRGIAVIWSAGNSGTDTAGTTNNCAARNNSFVNSYALIPGVISVAAASRDGAAITAFSSCGRLADTAHDPTVAAPGGDIVSARGKAAYYVDALQTSNGMPYIAASGTSMAAPHVAGVVALIQSARQKAGLPKLTVAAIKNLLVGTADLIPGIYSRKQGAGLVDAAQAVAQAIAVAAPARADLCHDVKDPEGDATQAIVNTVVSQVPSLDVTSARLAVDGTDLVGTIKVKDLNLLDVGGVNGLYFDFNFQIPDTDAKNGASTRYYLSANYSRAKARVSQSNPSSSSVGVDVFSYGIGRYDTTRTGLVSGTGSFNEATDTVTIRVPLSRITGSTTVYNLNSKTLNTVQVVSRRDLHNIIADADTAWGTEPYGVGDPC